MRKKHTKFIMGLLILVMCLTLLMPIALAEEEAATEAINVFMPSVSIKLTGARQDEPEEYEIILKADDPSYPMPDASVDGVFSAIAFAGDMITLSTIQFSSVGTYTYTVFQTPGTNDLGNYDDSVFHITVYITNAPGDGGLESTVIARKDGETKKLEFIEFVNDYEIELPDEEVPGGEVEPTDPPDEEKPAPTDEPDKSDVPKTGDSILIWPYIVSFIGAGILLLVLVLTRKKNAKE